MAQSDRITLVFIINGQDFSVQTNTNAPLLSAVERALTISGNTGRRDPQEWEVRDANGVLLQMGQKISDLNLHDGARLFLTLRVGAGGNSQ